MLTDVLIINGPVLRVCVCVFPDDFLFLLRPLLTKCSLRGRSQTREVGVVLHQFRVCFQRCAEFSGRGVFDPSIFFVFQSLLELLNERLVK